jgi:hypothetical protein
MRATTPAGDLASCTPGKDGGEGRVASGVTVTVRAEGTVASWSPNCTPMANDANACTVKMTADKTVTNKAPDRPAVTKTPTPATGSGGGRS